MIEREGELRNSLAREREQSYRRVTERESGRETEKGNASGSEWSGLLGRSYADQLKPGAAKSNPGSNSARPWPHQEGTARGRGRGAIGGREEDSNAQEKETKRGEEEEEEEGRGELGLRKKERLVPVRKNNTVGRKRERRQERRKKKKKTNEKVRWSSTDQREEFQQSSDKLGDPLLD
ncbi:uncharacterized protein LOC143215772 [Lasioglossum baleicum]|uniref:uncharacterized protein LOC143215772 n=1 Tax=Lasioglossum baleicum TaxID=434251 RepID=UPI003FCE2BC4